MEENIPKKEPVKGLHTYSSDMAEALRKEDGSVIKIAIAEQKKREKDKENFTPTSKKNIIMLGVSVVLIIIAITVIIYFISISGTPAPVPVTGQVSGTLIYAENKKVIDTTDLSTDRLAGAIANEINNSSLGIDVIENISLQKNISINPPSATELTTREFFNDFGADAPDTLVRSLGEKFMIGVDSYNGNELFILFKTNSLSDTRAGMLTWENKMFDNIYSLFNIPLVGPNTNLFNTRWTDATIKNKDARAIRDSNGKIVLYYLFPNDNTVLITTGSGALDAVVARLNVNKTQ